MEAEKKDEYERKNLHQEEDSVNVFSYLKDRFASLVGRNFRTDPMKSQIEQQRKHVFYKDYINTFKSGADSQRILNQLLDRLYEVSYLEVSSFFLCELSINLS